MRRLLFVGALLFAGNTANATARLEVESDFGLSMNGPAAPVLAGRVGVDFAELATALLDGQLAIGGGVVAPPCPFGVECARSGYRGWLLLPELRLRTPTPILQGDFAIGVGLGTLNGVTLSSGIDTTPGVAPAGQVAVGLRTGIPSTRIFFRLEASVTLYTAVVGPDVSKTGSSGVLPMFQLLFGVGYDGPGF